MRLLGILVLTITFLRIEIDTRALERYPSFVEFAPFFHASTVYYIAV